MKLKEIGLIAVFWCRFEVADKEDLLQNLLDLL